MEKQLRECGVITLGPLTTRYRAEYDASAIGTPPCQQFSAAMLCYGTPKNVSACWPAAILPHCGAQPL